MARTKETKMFPEQQEKMTQEVMASLQPSTYGKDYAQKHSSFFEEVENSDLEVVTENVAATTSNMEDELTNEVQSPPNPQKRISGKQRKATLEEYQQTFLQVPRIDLQIIIYQVFSRVLGVFIITDFLSVQIYILRY